MCSSWYYFAFSVLSSLNKGMKVISILRDLVWKFNDLGHLWKELLREVSLYSMVSIWKQCHRNEQLQCPILAQLSNCQTVDWAKGKNHRVDKTIWKLANHNPYLFKTILVYLSFRMSCKQMIFKIVSHIEFQFDRIQDLTEDILFRDYIRCSSCDLMPNYLNSFKLQLIRIFCKQKKCTKTSTTKLYFFTLAMDLMSFSLQNNSCVTIRASLEWIRFLLTEWYFHSWNFECPRKSSLSLLLV